MSPGDAPSRYKIHLLETIEEFIGADEWVHEFLGAWLPAQKFRAFFAREDIVPFIDWFRADDKLGHIAKRAAGFFDDKMTVDDGASVEQIGRERLMFALGRITMNVAVAEQSLGRAVPGRGESDQ